MHQLQLMSPSPSCSIAFYFSSLARSRYLSYFSFFIFFTPWSAGTSRSTIRQVLFFVDSFYSFKSFFPSALVDGCLLESERQQDFSSLQDSFWYSGRIQQCCILDGLHSSSYFQVLQSLYQSFVACTERTNNNWYHRQFHVS